MRDQISSNFLSHLGQLKSLTEEGISISLIIILLPRYDGPIPRICDE